MPKTIKGLWGDLIDFDNIYNAYLSARSGKRLKHEVMQYAASAEENAVNLQNHLIWKTWKPSESREFVVLEPKRRVIQAPPFCDRVLHHALVRIVEPIFERKFIYDSYACRKGKGTQAAVSGEMAAT